MSGECGKSFQINQQYYKVCKDGGKKLESKKETYDLRELTVDYY